MALDSAPENIWRGLLLDATRNAKTPDANLVVVGNAGVGKATLVRALGAAAVATSGAGARSADQLAALSPAMLAGLGIGLNGTSSVPRMPLPGQLATDVGAGGNEDGGDNGGGDEQQEQQQHVPLPLRYSYFDANDPDDEIDDDAADDEAAPKVGVWVLRGSHPTTNGTVADGSEGEAETKAEPLSSCDYESLLSVALSNGVISGADHDGAGGNSESAATDAGAAGAGVGAKAGAKSGSKDEAGPGIAEADELLQSLLHTVVVVAVDLARPWAAHAEAQAWTRAVCRIADRLVARAKLSVGATDRLRRRVREHAAAYRAPTSSLGTSDTAAEGQPDEGKDEGKGEGEGTAGFEAAVGSEGGALEMTESPIVPIIVVACKADIPRAELDPSTIQVPNSRAGRRHSGAGLMSPKARVSVAAQPEVMERRQDFLQFALRRHCLRYGAALAYVSAASGSNVRSLHRYVLKRLYDTTVMAPAQGTAAAGETPGNNEDDKEAMRQRVAPRISAGAMPQVIDRAAIFVPSGYDSSAVIGEPPEGWSEATPAAEVWPSAEASASNGLHSASTAIRKPKLDMEAKDEQQWLQDLLDKHATRTTAPVGGGAKQTSAQLVSGAFAMSAEGAKGTGDTALATGGACGADSVTSLASVGASGTDATDNTSKKAAIARKASKAAAVGAADVQNFFSSLLKK